MSNLERQTPLVTVEETQRLVVQLLSDVTDCHACTRYNAKDAAEALCMFLGIDLEAACEGEVRWQTS